MKRKWKVNEVFLFLLILGLACLPTTGKAIATDLELDDQFGDIGHQVTFTLSVTNAPNDVDSLGVDIGFDQNMLEYVNADFTETLLVSWSFKDISNPEPGFLRLGGFTTVDAITSGTSGALVKITFTVIGNQNCQLPLSNLVDDIAIWTTKDGYFTYNRPPVADAGLDQTVNQGDTVSLNGSNSYDPDNGDGIASYHWKKPPDIELSDPTSAQPTFMAPEVCFDKESLSFELTVTDYGGLESTDTCIVDVIGKPVLSSPNDGDVDVSLTPVLQTEYFCDTHTKTQWQISTSDSFSELIYDLTSTENLTSLTVPASVLKINTIYYWRVKFYNDNDVETEWSDQYSFTTITVSNEDPNSNGIPDDQEVDDTVDLDGDGTPDNMQGNIKSLNSVVEGVQVGVKTSTGTSIESIESITLDSIPETEGKPEDMPFGLINYKLVVQNAGDVAQVTACFSVAAPSSTRWYKYSQVNGWQDYTEHAFFSVDRKSVTLELKDGGFGDADGTENGVIIDPSGVAVVTNNPPDTPIIVSPGDEVILEAGPLTLTAREFSDPDEGDTHVRTHWKIRRADRREWFYNEASTTDLTHHTVSGLEDGLKYVWEVGYEDSSGDTSWSQESTFIVGILEPDSSVQISPGIEVADFRMISFVQWPEYFSAENVLGNEVAVSYDQDYRIGTYDPITGKHIEYGKGLKIEPGRAYWFLARNGLSITVNGVPVSLYHDIDVELLYNSDTVDGWNMIGCPNNANYKWDYVQVVEYDANGAIVFGPTAISVLSDPNDYIDKRLWRWVNGEYASDTTVMEAYEGYWVKVKKANISLKFPVAAQTSLTNVELQPTASLAISDPEDLPPRPMGDVSSGGDSSEGIGGCFINAVK